MDTTKLRMGELIAGACAVLLFIDMFFHWYGIKGAERANEILKQVTGTSLQTGVSAWQAYSWVDLLLLLTIIAALGMVALSVTQRSVALPVSASVIVTGLGAFAALIVLYRLINQPGPNDLVTVKLPGYIGFLLTAGVAVGGWQAMREEGTSFGQAAEQIQGGGRRPAPPPAQPAAPPPPAPTSPAEPPAGGAPPSTPPPSAPPPGSPGGPPAS
jgi:hypothetical protein